MIIYKYQVSPAWLSPNAPKYIFRITITDNQKDNVATWFHDKNTNSFSGFNILDYGRSPRKNATLALRVSRIIKEQVLDFNCIKTMLPTRLQHWPKYKKPSSNIKI